METRAELEAKLESLHQQRGTALLSGGTFDNQAIVELDQRLAALADLDKAKAAQAREEAAKALRVEVNAIRAELADLTAASTKALAEAETNLRAAVAAQRLHHQHETAKRKLIGRLTQLTGAKESALSEFELCRQESRLWLAQLNTLTNAPGQYGDLRFPSLHLPNPSKSWT